LSGDLRRRYLQQQMEMGGTDVILPAGMDRAAAAPPPSPVEPGTPPSAPTTEPTSAGSTRPASAEEKWRVDAPAIPGPGRTVTPAPGLISSARAMFPDLGTLADAVRGCDACPLCRERAHAVPGEGNPEARLMLVGEGPGATEDETGRPFVGRAGELLNGILGAIGLTREEVFIANVVKCRPPKNRKPLPDEMAACFPYLHRQITLVKPRVLLALGGTAAEALLDVRSSLGQLRGAVHRYDGIPLIVTYHPAALLRNPQWKKPTWDDVRIARQLLDG